MQAPFDILADLDTPVSAYMKLADLRPRYLLESVERGQRLARYSFLGFGEAEELSIADGVLRRGDATSEAPANQADYLDVLRTALAEAPRLSPEIPELPFWHAVTLADLNVNIVSSIIATYGEHAVDVFYVKDLFGHKIRSKNKMAQIEHRLTQAIEAASPAG